MRLSELLTVLSGVERNGDAEITGIQVDSRRVRPGDLFVALRGHQTDGHRFLANAQARGASAFLISDPNQLPPNSPAWACVPDTRDALWRVAKHFYGDPSASMTVIGVTGTNGKTTTTHYIQQIVLAMGEPCLLIGTLGATLAYPSGERERLGEDIDFTTPEVFQIQALLREALDRGARYAVMEVSSHALDQKRADGIHFSAGVFTNLTQDHLDYHGTMEAYAQAKLRLFTELTSPLDPLSVNRGGESPASTPSCLSAERFISALTPSPSPKAWIEKDSPHPPTPSPKALGEGEKGLVRAFHSVINLDAEWGAWFAERAQGERWTYGTGESARVRATDIEYRSDGILFTVHCPLPTDHFQVFTSLRAPYNLYNALGAIACALSLNIPLSAIQDGIANLTRVPGRFEKVPLDAPFEVFVDFAHTPDALERVLETARMLNPTRLTVLFGCGGDRDPLKRPKMGAIASRLADRVVLTSDNPRTEDPQRILDQILEGIPASERARVIVEPDRRRAIELALADAQPGEILLLAGKGHEEYQIIGTTRYPFSDRQVVLEVMGVKTG